MNLYVFIILENKNIYIFCLFAQVIQEQIRLVFTVFANLNEQQIDFSLSLSFSL